MIQPGLHGELTLEALDLDGGGLIDGKDFRRIPALGEPMLDLKYLAQTTSSDNGNYFVVSKCFSDMQAHCVKASGSKRFRRSSIIGRIDREQHQRTTVTGIVEKN